jgi:chaperone modulatory protein CbpM
MKAGEFLLLARLDHNVLNLWVESGWLMPRSDRGAWQFSEVDLARVQLILDLKQDLGVNDEGVPIILDLVDQITGLRRVLDGLIPTLHALATTHNGSSVRPPAK